MESQRKLKHTHNTLFTNCPSNRQAQTDIFCCAPTRTKNGRHQDIFSFFFCVFEWKRERIVSFKKITRDSRRKRTKKWTVCYSLRGCPPTTWPRKLKRNFTLLLLLLLGQRPTHADTHNMTHTHWMKWLKKRSPARHETNSCHLAFVTSRHFLCLKKKIQIFSWWRRSCQKQKDSEM